MCCGCAIKEKKWKGMERRGRTREELFLFASVKN